MRTLGVAISFILLAAALAWAIPQDDQAQPSLADVARQQKAAKQKEAPAKHVYTNDNLPTDDGSVTTGTTTSAGVAPVSSSSAGTSSSADASGQKSGKPGTKKVVDPARVKAAQEKLAEAKQSYADVVTAYNRYQQQLDATKDDFRRETLQELISHRDDSLGIEQKKVNAAQQELDAAMRGDPVPGSAPQQGAQGQQAPSSGDQSQPPPQAPQPWTPN